MVTFSKPNLVFECDAPDQSAPKMAARDGIFHAKRPAVFVEIKDGFQPISALAATPTLRNSLFAAKGWGEFQISFNGRVDELVRAPLGIIPSWDSSYVQGQPRTATPEEHLLLTPNARVCNKSSLQKPLRGVLEGRLSRRLPVDWGPGNCFAR